MKKISGDWKVWLGIVISMLFMFLAFRDVAFGHMWEAVKQANYWWILPALLVIFLGHWLRAYRWRFLLAPIDKVDTGVLFSSLMIGYMANTFLPAHLGEFLRAYMIGKKRSIPASAVFGTIVIERVIDVLSLVVLLVLTMMVFPFPDWVKQSSYISFAGILVLLAILVLMKTYRDPSLRLIERLSWPLPERFAHDLQGLLRSFLDGIVLLQSWRHYVIVTTLSIAIWFCYGLAIQIGFYAFDFVSIYALPWTAALVLLVITTISVLVPSSPGYVGTYHYLCQLSLGLFAVPESPALTFAFVLHGINFLPILIVGLILISAEGMSVKSLQQKPILEQKASCT